MGTRKDADQSGHGSDPRNARPAEAAMSMRQPMPSNTGGPTSSLYDASGIHREGINSLKLQNNNPQRRKDKDTKGLVFQNASKNR